MQGQLSRKPVLLTVDDNASMRELVSSLCGKEASILRATNGREALEMIRLHKPDLVLLDDSMPEMTGLTLVEILHKDPQLAATPVIMLTGSNRMCDIRRAMAAGAVDYVVKPFNPQLLIAKVRKQLAKALAQKEAS